MKKILLFILVLAFPISSFAATGVVLKLSLTTQMRLQTIQDKKVANMARLATLRAERTMVTTAKTKISTPSTARLAAQQANLTRLAILRAQKTAGITPTSTGMTNIQQSNTPTIQPSISGVDMNRVRSTWLGWYNDYRRSLGLSAYAYDGRLDATAYSWNMEFAKGGGQNHHRRSPNDSYYDYPKITTWFKDRGVVGMVVNGATTTENVGWGSYSCSSGDCTNSLIASIRTTFDFFMSEKSYGGSHYKSIVQPNFTKVGFSVIVQPSERRYYLTVHYITEFQ